MADMRTRPSTWVRKENVPVACPTCGASGDDPCLTPSGKVKDEFHAKRSS